MQKRISILGSTGSIGVNALSIIAHLREEFTVEYLSANQNIELLIDQVITFNPKGICVVDEKSYQIFANRLKKFDIEILVGRQGLLEMSSRCDVDIMLNALVGASGMEPTINAIEAGVDIALSNKESLVMAGDMIKKSLLKSSSNLLPVDSEHSAIWQCLAGEKKSELNKIILTGSGGPFRKRRLSTFNKITLEEALKHPNWEMGKKITIDSATMMNKTLEIIEAYWLFDLKIEQIEIVVHPQSIIHSMIEMKDGSIKAQLGVPDMKIPIQYALTYPRHIKSTSEKLNFFECGPLTFQKPDFERFPSILLAFEALEKAGTSGAALNLANDYSVFRFLNNEISFIDISKINKLVLARHPWSDTPSLKDLFNLDKWVKHFVLNYS